MKQFYRTPLNQAVSMALAGTAIAATVVAPVQADSSLEEVVVTAQKRAANLQDVAVSIQVLGTEKLEDLQIKGFEDYILFLPTVSYTSNGPGYGQVYMRGISSGGDGVHSGSMPSVGVYLDEQPVTTINQILDVHVYDIARVETLSGPQGTLYGQGSQAGTIRIITNKPVIGEFQGGYDIYADTVDDGDPGFGIDAFVNIPVNDRVAIRLVAWHQDEGGWIDNVPGTIEYAASGIVRDNAALIEDDFNTVETTGFRAQAKIDLNDRWTLTPGINYQTQDATGVWFDNEGYTGNEREVSRFFPDYQDEDWYQASLTLEGKIGNLDLVYAGAYLDRDVENSYDYSGYAEYLEDLYGYYGYYCLYYDALGDCADGSQFVHGDETFERFSHELRLQSDQDQRFRWIAGLFYQRQEHLFDLQWVVPDMNPADSVVQNGVSTWQTHQQRIDRDKAVFGEVYFDLTDAVTLTVGGRYFEYENSLFGFNGFLRHCTGFYDDNGNFVQDNAGEPQFPCFDTGIVDDVADGDDTSWKGSVEWRVADDKLLYFTYSEGFRAGGVNRARVPGIPKYQPDFVENYEIGWKTQWAGGTVRFNGAAYLIDWKDFQFGFLDFTVSNLTIIQNVGNAQTRGVEFELDWQATDQLLLSFSGSYNDAELEEAFWRSDQDRLDGLPPDAPKGTPMPYVPEWQYTAIGRWNFDAGSLPAFAQFAFSYRDGSFNDLESTNSRRDRMDSYSVLNLSTGIEKDNWSLTLYANNVTDERGQIDIGDPGYFSPSGLDYNTNYIKPRSYGIRWAQRF
ncbi:TonB-dependent receptor [Elongatibacter sediminis]|uniref:TonB-dependent receptor n=1 Tax=Elongatibacter sediminis TaxID=3119006 RepID=A0AAW9RAJ8_9GAMM